MEYFYEKDNRFSFFIFHQNILGEEDDSCLRSLSQNLKVSEKCFVNDNEDNSKEFNNIDIDNQNENKQQRVDFSEFFINKNSVFVPNFIGDVNVSYKSGVFHLRKNENYFKVQQYNLSKDLRGIDNETLIDFLKFGYLSIKKIGDEYGIDYKARMLGGGPISGAIAYWATKTLCYGTAVAGAVSGGLAAGATLGASAGATVVGGAIAGAGLATEAAMVTTGVVTSAGGIAGAVAAVETASIGACALFTAIPFLP